MVLYNCTVFSKIDGQSTFQLPGEPTHSRKELFLVSDAPMEC